MEGRGGWCTTAHLGQQQQTCCTTSWQAEEELGIMWGGCDSLTRAVTLKKMKRQAKDRLRRWLGQEAAERGLGLAQVGSGGAELLLQARHTGPISLPGNWGPSRLGSPQPLHAFR